MTQIPIASCYTEILVSVQSLNKSVLRGLQSLHVLVVCVLVCVPVHMLSVHAVGAENWM